MSKLIIVAQIKMFLLACFGNAFKSNEYVQNSKAGIWSWGKRWSYTENRCWIFMEQWKEWILKRELQGRSFPFYIRSVRNQVLKEMSPLLTIYTTRDDNDIHHLKKLHGRKWPEDFGFTFDNRLTKYLLAIVSFIYVMLLKRHARR